MKKVFVEIGVCDFDTLLPLCENGWKGYFIEPVEKYTNFLVNECKENNYDAVVSKCAISSFNGEIDFYVSNGNAGEWSKGISHPLHQRGEKLLELQGNKHLLEKIIKVPCFTLDAFLHYHKVSYIDYLKIDVEGHEMEVMESYSWKVKPSLIKMEHSHINSTEMKNLLEYNGYLVYMEKYDLYALRK